MSDDTAEKEESDWLDAGYKVSSEFDVDGYSFDSMRLKTNSLGLVIESKDPFNNLRKMEYDSNSLHVKRIETLSAIHLWILTCG